MTRFKGGLPLLRALFSDCDSLFCGAAQAAMPPTSETLHSPEKSYMQRFHSSSRFFSYGVAKPFVYGGVIPVVSVLRSLLQEWFVAPPEE